MQSVNMSATLGWKIKCCLLWPLPAMSKAGCYFPRELTNIVHRKCLKEQEILMEIFQKLVCLIKPLHFSTALCLIPLKRSSISKYILGWTKHNCSNNFEISQEIWDDVSPSAGSQDKNAALMNSMQLIQCMKWDNMWTGYRRQAQSYNWINCEIIICFHI